MDGASSSMCIAFSILMLGYILSVGSHVGCQDLGQQNPGGIHGGIGGIPGGILPRIGGIPTRIMACSGGIPPGIPSKIGRIPPEAFHNPTWD